MIDLHDGDGPKGLAARKGKYWYFIELIELEG